MLRVSGLVLFRVSGSGFGVSGLGFRVKIKASRVLQDNGLHRVGLNLIKICLGVPVHQKTLAK